MSVDPRVHHASRASPVPELPLERLVDRAEELARRWAIALVLARPLETLAEVPLEELAREAPLLCAQILRALCSEEDLEALERSLLPAGGDGTAHGARASRLAEISGARGAIALAETVEALRGVLWRAVAEQLDAQGDGSTLAFAVGACDRLAFVCSRALVASLAGPAAERHPAAQPARPGAGAQRIEAPQRIALTPALARFERFVGDRREERAPAPSRRLLIVDERAPASAAERREEVSRAPQEIEVRDVRSEHGRAPWVAAIARELEVYRRAGRGFAVLVIELRGQLPLREAEHIRRGAAGLAADVERVLSAELRQAARALTPEQPGVLRAGARSGSLTREGPGRFWMIAPQLDRSGAASLVRRLERAVARPASHGGGPLDVTIGAAVCPEDGTDATALAEHADLELYASRPSSAGFERLPDGARDRRY